MALLAAGLSWENAAWAFRSTEQANWHPLHVESVAWAAECKDVLSGVFWMLTLWAYARYVERPWRRLPLLVAEKAPLLALASAAEKRLAFYRERKPYREGDEP